MFTLEQATKPKEVVDYSSTLPSTSTLDGVCDQRQAPARFTPGEDPVPIV
jgi:hypothetical protein